MMAVELEWVWLFGGASLSISPKFVQSGEERTYSILSMAGEAQSGVTGLQRATN